MNRKHRKQFAQILAGGMAWTGITSSLLARRRRRADFRIFILDYHEVERGPIEREGVVSADRFRRHIHFLKQRFDIVSLAEAVDRLAAGPPLDRDSVVITLDDGYIGNYEHAFGALRDEGVPATVFVATAFVDGEPLWTDLGRRAIKRARAMALPDSLDAELEVLARGWKRGADPIEALKTVAPPARDELIRRLIAATGRPDNIARAMSWRQISEMAAAGIEIGCHTVNHPILPTLSATEQLDEIDQSRSRIAEMTGIEPTVFAYPNGDYDENSIDALRGLGFAAACTTRCGSNTPGCDPYQLSRIGIGADSNHLVAARLTGIFDQQYREQMVDLGPVRSQAADA